MVLKSTCAAILSFFSISTGSRMYPVSGPLTVGLRFFQSVVSSHSFPQRPPKAPPSSSVTSPTTKGGAQSSSDRRTALKSRSTLGRKVYTSTRANHHVSDMRGRGARAIQIRISSSIGAIQRCMTLTWILSSLLALNAEASVVQIPDTEIVVSFCD